MSWSRLLFATGLVMLVGVAIAAAMLYSPRAGQQPEPIPAPAPAPAPSIRGPWFADVTDGSGLDFTYRNGEEANHYTLLESLGGGVALIDYDQDGLLDIFIPGGGTFVGPDKKEIKGRPNRLFKNLGGLKFKDVTAEVGLPTEGVFYSHGAIVGDFNNDGWPDLLVTGYGRMALYRNDHGKFVDVTAEMGLTDPSPFHWSTSAAWGDLDGDGWPDLFVCHYGDWSFRNHPPCEYPNGKIDVCPPHRFNPLPSALYKNKGGNGFVLQKDVGLKPGRGLGVLLADLDGNGRLDIFVSNDAMEKFLYLNRGGGKFQEVALTAGVAYDENGRPTGSMGLDAADCDGSGRLSLFIANYEGEDHALFRNAGAGRFLNATRTSGIGALGRHLVGFGTGLVDFDRDGQPDLFLANGHVLRHPSSGMRRQEAIVLRNLRNAADPPGAVRFENVSSVAGGYFKTPHTGRGVAFGDLDNDGKIDVVISHLNEPVVLLHNVADIKSQWLGVALRGQAPRDAVGARLTLTQGDRRQVQVIKGGGSYLSSNDPRVVFALEAGDYQLTVRWPSGRVQAWAGDILGRDRYIVLDEGEDSPRPYPSPPRGEP
jgi:hypothetical protein